MDYPPNSRTIREEKPEEKKIERVTTAEATRRKKPLGKQFRETFLAGDAKSAMNYVFFGVLIPAAKDMMVDAGREGLERLVYGDSRRHRSSPRPGGPTGYVSYNRMSQRDSPPPMQRSISRRARSQHDFDEIVLTSRGEAEEVLDRLFDLISRYESASVADLYELTGLDSKHTDHKWGWTELRGATVRPVRGGGYLLDLPSPEPLD